MATETGMSVVPIQSRSRAYSGMRVNVAALAMLPALTFFVCQAASATHARVFLACDSAITPRVSASAVTATRAASARAAS